MAIAIRRLERLTPLSLQINGPSPSSATPGLSVTRWRPPTDPEALAELFELHASARPRVLDATYGAGRIWGRLALRRQVIKVDVNPDLAGLDLVADWLELPLHFGRGCIDVLVWDPIHVADVGQTSRLYSRYAAAQRPVTGSSVTHLFPGFLDMAEWLVMPTSGICLVKLSDQVHSGRQQWQLFELKAEAERRGWTACDYTPVQNGTRRPADPKHAAKYHVRNQWAFWIVLRNGPACQGPGRRLKHRLVCQACGRPFNARRSDARTHAGPCRQRLYRRSREAIA